MAEVLPRTALAGRRLPRRLGRARAAVLAMATAAVAAGCANVPVSGSVQLAQGGNGAGQEYPQLLAEAPGLGWQPDQIVLGFLHASAAGFRNDHAVARHFLTPGMSSQWKPSVAANVLAGDLKSTDQLSQHLPDGAQPTEHVIIKGQQLATLTDSGQYITSSVLHPYSFALIKLDGQWLISSLPSNTSLLLTKPDFDKVYAPRNLYFFAAGGLRLVPDPVFVPQSAANTDVANGLIRGLLTNPAGWLSGAAGTLIPRGTTLRAVRINGSSAVVDLGGPVARVPRAVLAEIAGQLVWTLTSSSYGQPPVAQSVQLAINGVIQRLDGSQYQLQPAYAAMLTTAQPGAQLYFLHGTDVSTGTAVGARAAPGFRARSLSQIAISRPGTLIAGLIPAKDGCTVESGPLYGSARPVFHTILGGRCTSMSWDQRDNIWVAAGRTIWVLLSGQGQTSTAAPLGAGPVTDFQVAPDGVRVAMIGAVPGGTQLAVGAISAGSAGPVAHASATVLGAGIRDPSQAIWYTADDLLVLASPGPRAALYKVPVNGDAPAQFQVPPGTVWIATDGADLAAGTASGEIFTSAGPSAQWVLYAAGQDHDPSYRS